MTTQQTASATLPGGMYCPSWCTADHHNEEPGEWFHYRDFTFPGLCDRFVTVAYPEHEGVPCCPPVVMPHWEEITPRNMGDVEALTSALRTALLMALGEDTTQGAVERVALSREALSRTARAVRVEMARSGITVTALADMVGVPYERLVSGLSGSGTMSVEELRDVALTVGEGAAR